VKASLFLKIVSMHVLWVGNFIPLDSISKSNLTYFQTQQMPPRRAPKERMQQMMEAQAQLMQVMTQILANTQNNNNNNNNPPPPPPPLRSTCLQGS
jgi:hypothetical protein